MLRETVLRCLGEPLPVASPARAEIRVKIRHRENEQKQEKRFFCVMQTTLLHLRSVPRARQGTPLLEWREEPPVAI